MTMDMVWDWPCGVAYYGVSRAYEATGRKEYLEMLINWTEEYLEMGLPDWTVNTYPLTLPQPEAKRRPP